MELLRIHIDGDWDAIDFSEFLAAIHRYNEFAAFRFKTMSFLPDGEEALIQRAAIYSKPIRVRRISYGSKGFTDLLGAAALIKEVRGFLEFLINYFSGIDDRKLNRQERRLVIAHSRIDLMEKLIRINKEHDFDSPLNGSAQLSEFLELPHFEPIAEAILDGRFVGTELRRNETDQDSK